MTPYSQDAQGGGAPSGQQRVFYTERQLDPARNPPGFVDRELSTFSVKFVGPGRGRGSMRAPKGGSIEGSYRVTGSWRELTAPGTFSLRLTRVSVFSGSREEMFYIRHSRLGTIYNVYFPQPGRFDAIGHRDQPILVLPPGTTFYAFQTNTGSAYNRGYSMEGLPS